MLGQPTEFWAKLEKKDGRVVGYHPWIDHSADVAACMEALLRDSILGRRLATLAGLPELDPVQVARLGVLAALHDAGKVNLGFQNKAFGRSPMAGHLSEIVELLCTERSFPEKGKLLQALAVEEMAGWVDYEDGLADLLLVAFSHHGEPVKSSENPKPHLWRPSGALDPFAGLEHLVDRTRAWFPEAWQSGGPLLPTDPRFQHAWAGILMLADWIGSNSAEGFFPFSREGDPDRMELARPRARQAIRDLGLAPSQARNALGTTPVGYQFMEEGFVPHPPQARMLELSALEGGSVVILEAATGAGKTEAALAHYLRLFQAGEVDGLYFALPTRTAATQIYRRVCEAVAAAFPDRDTRPPTVLAVPGYLSVDGQEGQRLAPFQVSWPEDGRRSAHRGWAAEHSKRYLAGAVAVGTVDQALLSSLTVPHAHLRGSALLRHLLVVDEVHASDVYMNHVLEAVLDHHLAAGGHALLMSATLGAEARVRLTSPPQSRGKVDPPPLAEARDLPYPAFTVARRRAGTVELLPVEGVSPSKTVRVELAPILESAGAIAARALHAARSGARVLMIRNTVKGCREVQVELEALAGSQDRDLLMSCAGLAAPHHARYARVDRRRLDDTVEAAFGKNRPRGGCVAIATQTVEQSLDLDADLLITDLAPLDVLLQRIGRLHRHRQDHRPPGFEVARVVILVPPERDLSAHIGTNGQPRGENGLGTVYPDLRILEATWACLEDHGELDLPRQNRLLVEAATHPDALETVVRAGGAAWKSHENHLIGGEFADRRMAHRNRLDREIGFWDLPPFPTKELHHRVPTRLGEEDRMVRFEEPVESPFGEPVQEMTIPYFLAKGIAADADTAGDVAPLKHGFRFRFGNKLFHYGRLGLEAADDASATAPSPSTESSNG